MSKPTEDARVKIEFTLNGEERCVTISPRERLLDLLRTHLGLTGVKEGCGEGECGSCTVLLGGLPVNSCLVPAFQVRGKRVDTVEAVQAESLLPLLRSGATQCGACTPGVVLTARWLAENPHLLASHDLPELMAGNLCRCTGYDGILEGVRAALDREEES
ncbi:MAG: (2Fe-2S)-binding protein [Phycisphaerales bacterium JB038]